MLSTNCAHLSANYVNSSIDYGITFVEDTDFFANYPINLICANTPND
jgi:hypothetical protein